MKIIIAILIIILIFCLIFISSARDYRIKTIQDEVDILKRDLESHCRFGNDDIDFRLRKTEIALKSLEEKVDYRTGKKEHCVVIYGDGEEVARYKVDDES